MKLPSGISKEVKHLVLRMDLALQIEKALGALLMVFT